MHTGIAKKIKALFRRSHRVPEYRQLEANDCGPTCIQMIAAYYGKRYPLKTLKQHCDMTRLGISLRDVTHCMEVLGFEVASVSVRIDEARRMPLPAIIYFKQGHFVVLENVEHTKKGYQYTIVDPSYGRVKMEENNLVDKWMSGGWGACAVMAPAENFGSIPTGESDEGYIRSLMETTAKKIFSENRRNLTWIAVLTLLVVMTNWAMPMLLRTTIDDGIMKKNLGVVWTMLGAQFMFFLGFMLTGNVSNLLSTKTSIKVNLKFMTDYFAKIVNLPMKYFDIGLRSDLMQRLGDLSRIESFITGNLLSIVMACLNVVVFSVLLLYYNWVVFAIFIIFSLVSFAYNQHFMEKRKHIDYASFSINSERHNTIYEMVMGMAEIKINNAQQARIKIWRRIEDKKNELVIRSIFLSYYMSNGGGLIGRLRDIILTAFCAGLVIDGSMTMGTMMMISFLLGQLSGPIGQLIGFSQNVQDARLSYGRINDIYEREEEVAPESKRLDTYSVSSGIHLKGVSFKYAGLSSPYVLKDITIDIPVGKVTAIVGASGSGKTTLLKLLLGFYAPDKGRLQIDDIDMRSVDLNTWRDKCGVVMQNGKIFSGTVTENIAFADQKPDLKRLKYATRVAEIDERIMTLPIKYNTRIGETGIDLSGGEKQRLFIARAVYRNPQFIFFDEATSSLDANTERAIMKNLDEFYKNRTVVIIAHRLSTVKRADNIIYLDRGQVVEQGTHKQLLAFNGEYARLVKNQLELD